MTSLRIDDRLDLRPLTFDHTDDWYAALEASRDFLAAWIRTPGRVRSWEDARAYIERCENERKNGTAHMFGIWEGERLIGEVLVFGIRKDDRTGEVGYWLSEGSQGKGIVTRSCRALIDFAFGELGLNRLEIRCATENTRSQAIARNLGFQHEGILRQAQWLNDRFVDHVVFGMLAPEWRAAGS